MWQVLMISLPVCNHGGRGEAAMKRLIVSSIVLVLVTLGWGDRGLGEQPPAPRGELRIVAGQRWYTGAAPGNPLAVAG